MSPDQRPRRVRVVLSDRPLSPPELRAIARYAQLPRWRQIITRRPTGRR